MGKHRKADYEIRNIKYYSERTSFDLNFKNKDKIINKLKYYGKLLGNITSLMPLPPL